jgi:hypothetical protein
MLQANILELPYLITDQPTTLHVATQLSQRVGRYWLVLGRAQIFKAPGGLLQLGIEAADVFLGYVEAPDEKAAELMAAKVFMLNEWQRKRLLVRKHP